MKKRFSFGISIILTFILIIHPLTVSAQEFKLPSGIPALRLEESIDDYVKEHRSTTAGLSIAVFHGQEDLLKKYYGYIDIEHELPVAQDSVMEWGSITKLLFWVSVMQLYEQGKLKLNEDISVYLPEGFLSNLQYSEPVTITHLMNHNAGFQDIYTEFFGRDTDYYPDLEAALAAHKPAQIYQPGTVTAYSNWSAALAAFIVERVSHLSFSQYVHQYIFTPLQMEHSALYMDLSDNPWVQNQRKQLQCYTSGRKLKPDCFYSIFLYPAGMCTSTLDDLETFAKALLDPHTILFQKETTRSLLFSPTSYYGDTSIPLNCHGFWMIPFAVPTYGHGGNTLGCSSYLYLDLVNEIGTVIMTNQQYESVYNNDMIELIYGIYDRSLYARPEPIPSGIYRPARTNRTGPLKLISLHIIPSGKEGDDFYVLDKESGMEKIIYRCCDHIRVPLPSFLFESGLVLLWGSVFLISLIHLVIQFLHFLTRWKKHQKKTWKRMERWNTLAGSLQVLLLCILGMILADLLEARMAYTYTWKFAVIFILTMLFVLTSIYGIIQLRTVQLPSKAKVYYSLTFAGLLITIINILYWNLYMFWAI